MTEARILRLQRALFNLWSVAIAGRFEPDAGQPGMVKDGIADRAIEAARLELEDYRP